MQGTARSPVARADSNGGAGRKLPLAPGTNRSSPSGLEGPRARGPSASVLERAVEPVRGGGAVRQGPEAEGLDDVLRVRAVDTRRRAEEAHERLLLRRTAEERRGHHVVGVAVVDTGTGARNHV